MIFIFKKIIEHYRKMDDKHLVLNGFYLLTGSSIVLTLSNRISRNQGLIHVYAPKSGFYFYLYNNVTKNLEHVFEYMINNWHLTPAIAIILFILLVRLILVFPLDTYITKQTRETHEKLKLLRPQLQMIHNIIAYQAVSNNQRKQLDNLRNQVLVKNKAKSNAYLIGLIVFIETIIGIELYQLIAYSPELAHAQFIGINLGSRSWTLAFSAALLSLIANVVRISGYTPVQKQNVGLMNYIMTPLSILASGLFFPAVITLYLFTIQFLTLIQNIIEYHILRKYIEHKYRQHKNQKIITIVTQDKLNEIMQKSN